MLATAPCDFPSLGALFDGTLVIPATAGRYFVAVQSQVEGKTWQGCGSREFGQQWFFDIEPGVVLDFSDGPMPMSPPSP